MRRRAPAGGELPNPNPHSLITRAIVEVALAIGLVDELPGAAQAACSKQAGTVLHSSRSGPVDAVR